MRCSICNRMIEINNYSLRENDDLCSICSDIVEATLADEYPQLLPKEYAFAGSREGLVLPKKFEN